MQRRLNPVLRLSLGAFTTLVVAFLFMPMLVVVVLSFSSLSYLAFPPPGWSLRWYEGLPASQEWLHALWSSLKVGVPVALLSVVFGVCAALVAARARVLWRGAFAALVAAPMMVPHIILAIGVYPTMVDVPG